MPSLRPRSVTGIPHQCDFASEVFPQRPSKPLTLKRGPEVERFDSSTSCQSKASVAQWNRAPGFEPGGCRFESYQKCQSILGQFRAASLNLNLTG